MSGFGMKLPKAIGQSVSLCPGISDVNLFRYRKRVIDLDDQVLHPERARANRVNDCVAEAISPVGDDMRFLSLEWAAR